MKLVACLLGGDEEERVSIVGGFSRWSLLTPFEVGWFLFYFFLFVEIFSNKFKLANN